MGDIDVARFDESRHLAIEERQQQSADVRTVDVSVCHDHQLVVAAFRNVKSAVAFVLTDAGSASGDDGTDFFVGEDLVDTRLLDVENLTLNRENRLVAPIATLLGGTTGRVAFDDVKLADRRVALGAVR